MSLQMKALAVVMRLTSRPTMVTAEKARRTIAKPQKPSTPPKSLLERHEVTSRQVEGFTSYTVAPRGRKAKRAALYLHGGAYVFGIQAPHWGLVSRLADAGLQVEVPDYGLAPQHTYREAYPFVTAVYRQLLEDFDPFAVVIAGDSAGAGLALGMAQTLVAEAVPQPQRLVLIAPWLDLTLTNPAIAEAESRDPWLTRAGLLVAGSEWAGGDDPAGPRLSPINGDLSGVAPISAYVGTRDLFHPDVRRFTALAAAAGTPVDLTLCEGAIHAYPLLPAPEGRAASRRLVAEMAGI